MKKTLNGYNTRSIGDLFSEHNRPKPNVIDLFAGVGGLSLGAVRAGFNLSLAVELDKHAVAAHKLNFPGFKHVCTDISLLDGTTLLQHAGLAQGNLDGLMGGSPCQGFSVMGQHEESDPRNELFVKFFDLVDQCRPKFFLAENVPGILHEKHAELRTRAFDKVKANYTMLEPFMLEACDFGAATSRERIFFIGYLADDMNAVNIEDFEAKKTATPTTVKIALQGLPQTICRDWITEEQSWQIVDKLPASDFFDRLVGHIPIGIGDKETVRRFNEKRLVSGNFGTRHSPDVEARYNQLKPGGKDQISKSVRLDEKGFCPTLRAGTDADHGSYQAVRPIHPTLPRVITPREAARLQGFPDWFRFAPSKWHSFRQIGNSVSPILAEAILSVIHTHLQID